ncbi:MAG: sigma 54-interacting transcriptional regulator [Anaerolineae bacterium]
MQPTSYPLDLQILTARWRTFIETRAQPDAVDPVVVSSWRRCAPLLNPFAQPQLARLNEQALRRLLISQFDLLAIARPVMEDIFQVIEGDRSLMVLLDNTGCVLLTLGDAHMEEEATRLGLTPGTYWDEGRVGTNAFALVLAERMPAQVVGAEHFLACFHHLVDAAAPIFQPSGRPIGVLGILGLGSMSHSHSTGIVVAGARALENQLAADVMHLDANAHLTLLNATMESIAEGVLAWDRDGIVTQMNRQAAELLTLNPRLVVGHPLQRYVQAPADLREAMELGKPLRDVEAHLLVNGRPVYCMLNLKPIRIGDAPPIGFLATLQPIQQIHQIFYRLSGAQAAMTFDDLKGKSADIQRVRNQARGAARGRGNVLLQGESGVGKHVVARAIHNASSRANGPFIAVNCRAFPRDLFLSEFLGYESGAFSGARVEGRPSKFELAFGGTLFLDEVETIPLEFHSVLGRVIETGEVMRLGGTRVIPVNVRVISSTDTDLDSLVAEGAFQANLVYRLSSIVIDMPSLRQRREDLPELIDTILGRMHASQPANAATVTPQALHLMKKYPWPGNIRELESALERASSLVASGQPIDVAHLPESVRRGAVIVPTREKAEPVLNMDEWNREALIRAGWATHGNLTEMAHLLGISRTTLWRKMRFFNLTAHHFQPDG